MKTILTESTTVGITFLLGIQSPVLMVALGVAVSLLSSAI